ncbi:hypothetical protein COCOBI_01-6520 [Coccomyxa sp. Obi]|nr:hypothetical protein COCOBI_01-6520 [Coccomyxa sp. Obi]
MSGKENMLAGDLDDVLQQAEESLGITPPAAKFQTQTSLNLGRRRNAGRSKGHILFATAPPAKTRRSFADSPDSTENDLDQDEETSNRTALYEKNMEIIELREQHNLLLARSQDARVNWEAALASKDKAITQLEEALAAERKGSEQARLTAASALSQADARRSTANATDAALTEARREVDQLRQQVAAQEARIAEARQSAAAAASGLADQTARTEHHMAMMQAQVKELQASLAQRSADAQQHQARAEAAQAANSALQNEIMSLQARLSELNALQQRSIPQQSMVAPGPAEWAQHNEQPTENHITGVMPSAQTKVAVEADKELENRMTRLQQRLVSRDASARKYKEAVKVLKARILEALKVATMQQQECEQLRFQLAESHRARESLQRELDAQTGQGEKQAAHSDILVLQSRLQALENQLSDQSCQHKAMEDRLGSTMEQLASAESRAADAEKRHSLCHHERDEAQQRAEALKARAEKAESYGQKMHRLLQAMRAHLEAAQKQQEAAQQQAQSQQCQDEQQNSCRLKDELSEAKQAVAAASMQAQSIQERAAHAERQCERLQAALSDEQEKCTEAQKRASQLEISFKGMQEQADMLRDKLAHAVADHRRAQEEAAKELAAARVAWEIKRRDELQDLQAQVDRTRHAQEAAEVRLAQLERCECRAQQTSKSVDGGSDHTARAAACRMQRLKEVLDMRERCIAQLQDKLREQQAQHAQVEMGLRAQLEKRVKALEDADKRFGELEALMRRLSVRSGIL